MKRSEMRRLIAAAIRNDGMPPSYGDLKQAEIVLVAIERFGMLPPKIEPIKPGAFYRACEYFKTCEKGMDGSCGGCNGPESRRNAVWEPED